MTGKCLYPASSLEEQIQGCLIGIAVGDALGAPFEGLPPRASSPKLKRIGGTIKDFHSWGSHPPGTWTDDTGLSLAGCQALIRHGTTGEKLDRCFRLAFRDWALSADCKSPGRTVYHAAKYGTPDVNSWATGALMRMAPIAIFSFLQGLDQYQTATTAYHNALLTHGHPLAVYPAVEMVMVLHSIFSGKERVPDEILDPGKFVAGLNDQTNQGYREYQEMRKKPLDELPVTSGLFMLIQVLESLGLRPGSTWCSLPGFEQGILKAVNGCYDRDTAGAVAGAILGAFRGIKAIPERWLQGVEKAEEILDLAEKLLEACTKTVDALFEPVAKEAEARDPFSLPGQPELEAFLTEQIIDVIQNEEAYQSMGIEFPPAFVLHGPPGCGKTYAVEALVEHLGWPCYYINSQSIGSIYIHEASMKVGKVFETAIQKAPSVVVIDEMDSFLGNRQGAQDYRVEEANEFLRQIQSASTKHVLVIGMTNIIERIDPAFLRKGRFDHQIQMGYPSPRAVRAVLEKLLADKPCVEGFSTDAVIRELTGRPLSDTAFVVREASRLAVRMGKDKVDDICLAQGLKLLTGKV